MKRGETGRGVVQAEGAGVTASTGFFRFGINGLGNDLAEKVVFPFG